MKGYRLSEKLFSRACRVIPGGVCHNIRYMQPFPLYIKKAEGAFVWDEDDNVYIDLWMGHFTHILGHAPEFVRKKVADFIKYNGYHFGLVNRYEVELAELICELLPCESIRFCSSGTEASMYAVRLARAVTGRDYIAKVEGGWHGANTDLLKGVNFPFDVEDSKGIPRDYEDKVVLIPLNRTEKALSVLEYYREKLAAVVVEPICGVGGFIPAEREYLKALREFTEKNGIVLIFDEVITGFRLVCGGLFKALGVYPDIVVLGKIIGGGFPIGAVAGVRDIMELSSWSRKKPDRVLIGGGTFSCNPVSMIAGIEVINFLKENEEVYSHINGLGETFRSRIVKARENGVPVGVTGSGSLFMVHLMLEDGQITTVLDIFTKTLHEKLKWDFKWYMLDRGYHLMNWDGAFSFAHTQEQTEYLADYVVAFAEKYAEELS